MHFWLITKRPGWKACPQMKSFPEGDGCVSHGGRALLSLPPEHWDYRYMPPRSASLWFLSIVSVHPTVFLKLHSQGRQASSIERKLKTPKDARVIVKDKIIPNRTATVTKSVARCTKGKCTDTAISCVPNGWYSPSRSTGHRAGHHTTHTGSAKGKQFS